MTSAQTIAQLDDTQNDDHIEPCASAEAEWDRSRYEHSTRGWRWTAESLYRFADGSWLYVIDGGKPQPLTSVPLDIGDSLGPRRSARPAWSSGKYDGLPVDQQPGWHVMILGFALMDDRGNVIAICDDDIRNATELTHGWGESTR